jgi:hypothetical protein
LGDTFENLLLFCVHVENLVELKVEMLLGVVDVAGLGVLGDEDLALIFLLLHVF